MSTSGPPGWRFCRSLLTMGLFLSNINCLVIPENERVYLSESLQKRACPERQVLSPAPSADYTTPTERVSFEEYPVFEDDLDFEGMDLVLQRQLERYKRKNMQGAITFGHDRYPLVEVKKSLQAFRQLVRRTRQCLLRGDKQKDVCLNSFRIRLEQSYAVYKPRLEPGDPRYDQTEATLFTGYYTPSLQVSLWPNSEYNIPIYAKPNDEWVARAGRYQIDFRQALAGRGLELYYAKDRFSVYLLQLEGGGKLTFHNPDGKMQSVYVSYAGSNGRQWRFLSTHMLQRNWILNPGLPYQRQFILDNPDLVPEIFSFCPSYVFFRETAHPPEGSDSVPLTDNRSIATDINNYGFKGVLTFVKTKRPRSLAVDGTDKDIEMMPFSRFVLDQDTGGAIRGKARADFYFGEGDYAELAANSVKQRGDIYFLMLKPEAKSLNPKKFFP